MSPRRGRRRVVPSVAEGDLPVVGEAVRVGPVAHGGFCIARLAGEHGASGRVLFVRHALPGELVRIVVTDASQASFWRADAIEVLEPAPERVSPSCPVFRPGGCGGCDWQHAAPWFQRELKRRVVAEQLHRLAKLEWTGEVELIEPIWSWRTRMRYRADDAGTWGQRAYRRHTVVPTPTQGCCIATAAAQPPVEPGKPGQEILRVDATSMVALGRSWNVPPDGFWQVHPAAPSILTRAVIDGLAPRVGERAWDLYCGVGLFAAALVDAGCSVAGIEHHAGAVAMASVNVPAGRFYSGDVARTLRKLPVAVDLIVLDPPRTGAGERLMQTLTESSARAIAYVACDPAALARDLAVALAAGWRVTSLRAFDLFPQTAHVECVCLMTRAK